MPDGDPRRRLIGRRGECDALDRLVARLRTAESPVLVLRGEAGVGKTALLEYLVARASGCRVVRAAGAESEMELAYAGLQQLCAPMLDRLDVLPGPQRDALGTAFGLSAGDPPDRFFVGLAVLSLCAEVARDRPLVCVVDDVQWLDRASVRAPAVEGGPVVVTDRRAGPQHPRRAPALHGQPRRGAPHDRAAQRFARRRGLAPRRDRPPDPRSRRAAARRGVTREERHVRNPDAKGLT
jgi:AAA ATPase-like protein